MAPGFTPDGFEMASGQKVAADVVIFGTGCQSGIDKLALSIFTRYSPADPATRRFSCPQCQGAIKDFDTRCGHCGHAFPACSFSGRPILDTSEAGACKTCKRRFLTSEAKHKSNCGLCHTPLPPNKF